MWRNKQRYSRPVYCRVTTTSSQCESSSSNSSCVQVIVLGVVKIGRGRRRQKAAALQSPSLTSFSTGEPAAAFISVYSTSRFRKRASLTRSASSWTKQQMVRRPRRRFVHRCERPSDRAGSKASIHLYEFYSLIHDENHAVTPAARRLCLGL